MKCCLLLLIYSHICLTRELTSREVCEGIIKREYGSPRVQTSFGTVEGKYILTSKKVTGLAFMRIPYAEPPVGSLRFEKPQWGRPWSGILNAKSYGAACMQNDTLSSWKPKVMSEDCLWLAIFAPQDSLAKPNKMYNVIYYVHGGGWEFDSPQMFPPPQILENFVSHGLIFVTVGYRLGGLGFWSTGTKEAVGNWGVHDIILGLKWVKQEIRAFGGNRDKVTIMGHSAAGFAVSQLTLSPLTEGLFHQAVVMSGTAMDRSSINNNLSQFRETAKALSCDQDNNWNKGNYQPIIDCLKQVPALKLTNTYLSQRNSTEFFAKWFGPTTWPRIDGPGGAFPESMESLAQKRRPMPLVTGTTSNEFAILDRSAPQPSRELLRSKCQIVSQGYRSESQKAIIEACLYHYDVEIRNTPNVSFYYQPMKEVVSDWALVGPVFLDASYMRQAGGTVYLYSFDYVSKDLKETASYHALDIFYIMGIQCPYRYNKEDLFIREKYSALFSNFVIYGKPTLNDEWKPLKTPIGFNYYSIDLTFYPKEFYNFVAVEFWAQVVPYLEKFANRQNLPKLSNFLLSGADLPSKEYYHLSTGNIILLAVLLCSLLCFLALSVGVLTRKPVTNRSNSSEKEKLIPSS